MLLAAGLFALITLRGLEYFWPAAVEEFTYLEPDGSQARVVGLVRSVEHVEAGRLPPGEAGPVGDGKSVERILVRIGSRELTGQEFRLLLAERVLERQAPWSTWQVPGPITPENRSPGR